MRRGFSKFIRGIEGNIDPLVPVYPFGETKMLASASFIGVRDRPIVAGQLDWVMRVFRWRSSPQGSMFWENVHNGYNQEEAIAILSSWREQGHV